jgi:hypothetical protein
MANGVAQCQAPVLLTDPHSRLNSSINVGVSFVGERWRAASINALNWPFCFTSHQTRRTSRPEP